MPTGSEEFKFKKLLNQEYITEKLSSKKKNDANLAVRCVVRGQSRVEDTQKKEDIFLKLLNQCRRFVTKK